MVKKDVVRTDRNFSYYKGREDNKHTMSLFDLLCTYALNHPNVSYCQGMCDLASPLLAVQDNEPHAYLLFCSLMQRAKCNFSFDSSAISVKFDHLTQLLIHFDPDFYEYLRENQVDNLLFAYRWLLLEMKREFSFEDSFYFMEVMWSTLPTLPSSTGVPLFEYIDTASASDGSNGHLSDSDSDSFLTSSSVSSDFDECEDAYVDKQETVLGAAAEGENDAVFCPPSVLVGDVNISLNDNYYEDEFYGELQGTKNTKFTDFSSNGEHKQMYVSKYLEGDNFPTVECDNFPTHKEDNYSIHGAESSSTDKGDNFSTFEEENFLSLGGDNYPTLPVSGQRQGSDSVDSGFGSRPNSPTQPVMGSLEPITESQLSEGIVFPPPKEFGYGNPFLLFAALALMLEQRDMIMHNKMDFNDIVMLFSGYKSNNNVHTIMKEAKQLYEAYITQSLENEDEEFEYISI